MPAAVARLVRRVRRLMPRGVVLCYHRVGGPRPDPAQLDVSAAHFAAHLAILRAQASPLSLAEFERRRRAGTLPKRAVAVTFDDGYADNLHTALPLLEQARVPAEVFIVTGAVGSDAEFWWDDVARACTHPARPSQLRLMLDDAVLKYDDVARDDAMLYATVSMWLRPRAAHHQKDAAAQLLAWAGASATPRESHRPLRVAELQRLAASPLIGIGSHTVTHPVLGPLDARVRAAEFRDSRAALAQWLGAAPAHLAYPFGDGDAVTPVVERAARAAGYTVSLTTVAQAAWRGNRAQAVPRIAMQDWDGDEFERRLALWFNE